MAIQDTSLLICAPMLQDYLVDKDTGLPLANGTVTMYKDNNRLILKNWYYQTGVFGSYTYLPLSNPLTLSAVGTIQDPDGNDVIPFYYPYDEDNTVITRQAYYVVVENANAESQFTRANFPFVSAPTPSIQGKDILTNFAINGTFWRFYDISSSNVYGKTDVSTTTDLIIAPGQHDSYRMPDIRFVKNNTNAGSSESLTFKKFIDDGSSLPSPAITPEYYVNFTCTNANTSETTKAIQVPISSHLATLLNSGNSSATIIFYARNNSGSSKTLTAARLSDVGTGITAAVPITLASFQPNTNWEQFKVTFEFPSMPDTISEAGDDAFYIQIGYPLNTTCNIDIASIQFYLSDSEFAQNNFESYDMIDTIISSPRSGDWRASLNSFAPYGWIALNDGTIGNFGSTATPPDPKNYNSVNAWPLFNLLWNYFSGIQVNGSDYYPIYDSAGSTTTYGANAYADWVANKRLSLPKSLGNTLIGSNPTPTTQAFTTSGSEFVVAGTSSLYTGAPIVFTDLSDTTKGVSLNTIYYVVIRSTTNIRVAETYAKSMSGSAGDWVTLTGSITGNIVSGLTATTTGEFAHLQVLEQIVDHTHDPTTSNETAFWQSATVPTQSLQGGGGLGSTNLATTGGVTGLTTQLGFNVVQPSIYYNVFLKL